MPYTMRRGQTGFTMIEMMVVVGIIGLLAALLLPILARSRQAALVGAARKDMSAIVIALEKYREDFLRYPPEDVPNSATGSEILAEYLCQRFKVGETHFGPYLDMPESRLKSGAKFSLRSPLGGEYVYSRINPDADGNFRNFIVIDPGLDKKAGGTVDRENGFVTSTPEEAADNIVSTPEVKK